MQCKYLKLINGDSILVTTNDPCDTFAGKEFIEIADPVLITSIKFPRGALLVETFVMQQWLRVSRQENFKLPTKNIIIATDVTEAAVEQYKAFVRESNEMTTELSSFGTQEEENGETFESLIEGLMSNSDEEEDESDDRRTTERTIH